MKNQQAGKQRSTHRKVRKEERKKERKKEERKNENGSDGNTWKTMKETMIHLFHFICNGFKSKRFGCFGPDNECPKNVIFPRLASLSSTDRQIQGSSVKFCANVTKIVD